MLHHPLLLSCLGLTLIACGSNSATPAGPSGGSDATKGGTNATSLGSAEGGQATRGGATTNRSTGNGGSTPSLRSSTAAEGGASGTVDPKATSRGGTGSTQRNTMGGASSTATSRGGTATTSGAPAGGAQSTSTTGSPPTGSCVGNCATAAAGSCGSPKSRITEITLSAKLSYDTSETGVLPLAISAKPGGGSRLAWMTGYGTNASSTTGKVHVQDLDCDDQPTGPEFSFEAHDFQDLAADAEGGVILLTRDAEGGGTLNCGDPTSLCGTPPSPAVACYDMYMVRHDCAGKEQWATKVTSSSATQVPYSAGTGYNYMVWWYQHHGRLASDGSNWAAYFCDAITVKNGSCVDIHQGDRMQVVDSAGNVLAGHDSFDLGCSHSGFTRIIWDDAAKRFVMVCKTDNDNRIAQPNPYRTVLPINLDNAYLGDLVPAKASGYWLLASLAGSIHLLHFEHGKESDTDLTLASANYPHLVRYGSERMLAVWSTTATGGMTAQVFDTSGEQVSETFSVDAPNHPYQSFKAFPDGSAAFATTGSSGTSVKIVRLLPCES